MRRPHRRPNRKMPSAPATSGGRAEPRAEPRIEHRPVLPREVLHHLAVRPEGVYVDATVGGGGHASEIARRLDPERGGRLLGLDVDPEALAVAQERLREFLRRGVVELVRASYVDLGRVLDERGIEAVDGVLFDLGLSSLQLASAERGFSFRSDGPLDMRFDPEGEVTAAQIVNEYPEEELVRVLREYGEERHAARIAAEIGKARRERPIETTQELVDLVLRAIPKPAQRASFRRGLHPATRTFQALRIAVNRELENLAEGLEVAFQRLKPGGRLVVISFHSLEDRLVKRFLQERARGCICPPELPVCRCGRVSQARIVGKALPSAEEIAENPRARSARLRALEKLEKKKE